MFWGLSKNEETKANFEYITAKENVKQQKYKSMRNNSGWNCDQWTIGSALKIKNSDSILLNEIEMRNHIY